jgi:hypothetical protein
MVEEASTARADADRYAETRAREADEAAMRLLRGAEKRASELGEAAAQRHSMLLDDITASETRMQQMAMSLREVADRLDAVVEARARARPRPGVRLARQRRSQARVGNEN